MRRVTIAWLTLSLAAVGCTTEPTHTASSSPPPASASVPASSPPATTPAPTPTRTPTPEEQFTALDEIVLSEPSALGASWSELFALPYGDAPEQLGTSPGGEGLEWGPSYGTQVPDGSWWFLDTAHVRLAHYSETGGYLGEVPIPEQYLAGGEYVQWVTPLALGDGTVVLQSTSPDQPGMLLLTPEGSFSQVSLPRFVGVKVTDGTTLYGFDQEAGIVGVDPRNGTLTPTDAFAGQAITGFTLTVSPGHIELIRPGVGLGLPVTMAGRESSTVHLSLEAADGADGVLNLLVSGIVEDSPGELVDAVGFVRVDAAGRGIVEAVGPLSSPADPADGLRLGVRLGDHRPWLMVIDTDAVRVYRRSA